MTLRPATRAAAAGVAALALAVSSVGTAAAAGHGHARGHHATHKHARTARPAAFALHGVVSAVRGNQVRVVVGHGRIGGRAVGHRVLTLTVTPRTHRHNTAKTRAHHHGHFASRAAVVEPTAIPVGTTIDATGTATGSTLTVTNEVTKPIPAEALYGMVEKVVGSVALVRTADEVEGLDVSGDEDDLTALDLSAATLNGAGVTKAADVKAGEYVVALGEADEDVMSVANASFFDTAPRVLVGTVQSSDAAAKSLAVAAEDDRDDADDEQSGAPHTVTVDASDAQVVVNGSALGGGAGVPATSFPAAGDKVLVVAQPSSVTTTGVSATLVFAFDRHDEGAAGENEGADD